MSIGDLNDDIKVGPRLLIVSLNHPSHRKCIGGFADLQVDFCTETAQCCMIPGLSQL